MSQKKQQKQQYSNQQQQSSNSQQQQSSNSQQQQPSSSNQQQGSNSKQQQSTNSSDSQTTDCDRPRPENLDKKPLPYNQTGTLSTNPASHTSSKYDSYGMARFDVGNPFSTGPLVQDNCNQEHIM